MKITLVNYAGGENAFEFSKKAMRLTNSLAANKFKGDFQFIYDIDRPEWPTHQQLNYAFKAYCIKEARDKGADIVIWADSAITLVKPFEQLMELVEKYPVMLPLNGTRNPDMFWNVGQWTDQPCLDYFGVTREEAYQIPTVISGVFSIDFRTEEGNRFFDEFFALCNQPGIINGNRSAGSGARYGENAHMGHRHDQSILSLMVHRDKIPLVEHIFADPANAMGHPKPLERTERTVFVWSW